MDAAYQSDLLLSYVQCICMLSNEEWERYVTSWFSNECHLGVEGVQVGTFLNVWQIITSQIICLALLLKRMQWRSVACVYIFCHQPQEEEKELLHVQWMWCWTVCGSLLQTIPHTEKVSKRQNKKA
jgi:hypothetical protein